jgi:hypothetical protein
VAGRMSWVSRRYTSRIEGTAYCMLGLVDVNMPLLYGEGRRAFMRLQLEIKKKSDNESVFAWRRNMRDFFNWETMQAADFLMAPPTYSYRRSFESEVNTIFRKKCQSTRRPCLTQLSRRSHSILVFWHRNPPISPTRATLSHTPRITRS